MNFIDTANSYNGGVSETMLGEMLARAARTRRAGEQGVQPDGSGTERFRHVTPHIMRAVEDSLRRLRTDYLDIYYIHHVDVQTPLEEMLRAFDDLITAGKVATLPAAIMRPGV